MEKMWILTKGYTTEKIYLKLWLLKYLFKKFLIFQHLEIILKTKPKSR